MFACAVVSVVVTDCGCWACVSHNLAEPNYLSKCANFPNFVLARQLILHIAASRGFRLRKGDVKTAFLSVDRDEARRDVYAEPPQEMRDRLQIA